MKTIKFSLLLLTSIMLSCSMDPYPNGDYTDESFWDYPSRVEGLVGKPYDYMVNNYDNNESAFLDCATDNAVMTNPTNIMSVFARGTLTTEKNPFSTYWTNDYKAIYSVNLFLKDRRGFNTKYILFPTQDSLVRHRLQGEAYALRAWFQWDLLQKFGGKDVNGIMKGFPIVTEPLDISKEINFERNSYDDCVKQIIADCDSAFKYLPIAHRDFLVPGDKTYAGGRYWGRLDGITTKAIKANVYLTWASPRFNPENNVARWDSAAKYAKQVIDFKLTDKTGTKGFSNPAAQPNWFDPNSPSIIFSSRYDVNDKMERNFMPGGFQGNGTLGASQELVNAFGMADGYPIDKSPLYDPSNPYLNRDPLFYSVIFYNGLSINGGSPTATNMYTFETFEGGKDAPGLSSTNSLTSYYVKKFVSLDVNWSDVKVNTQPHSKFFIRWEHMCLAFAEAANNLVGPNASVYGLTAKDAMSYLRTRKTYDGLDRFTTSDNYMNEEAAKGKDAFNVFVKNERRIETCFEGMRFFDLRRWTTNLTELNKAVSGAKVTLNPSTGKYDYDLSVPLENRNFKSAYLPIPYNEILKMSKLTQNEGWDSWR